MSQYFRTPPPVYARNWAKSQNLVESTKIERKIVSSKKTQRKEKKKESKKQKSVKPLIFPITKLVSEESEQLEQSCLTEEHNQLGYLSDGSQDSNKRRRKASPPPPSIESDIKDTHVASKPLRIRFVFKKPKEVDVVAKEEPVCSTSGKDHSIAKTSPVSVLNESPFSTSLEIDDSLIPSSSKKRKTHRVSRESQYKKLFDEWVPPCISMEEGDCNSDDDWLFGSRRQKSAPLTKASVTKEEDMTKKLMVSGDSSFPKAHFLSEVGIFALPYTVPF